MEGSSALRGTIDVLLVEDNPRDAEIAESLLARSASPHINLTHVTHLAAACAHLDAHRVDLIVLDLGLPDAFELDGVKRLMALYKGTPLVVMTGLDDDVIAMSAIHAGAQDFIIKGTSDRGALIRTFRYAIERHRHQRELAMLTSELQVANASLEKLSVIDPLTELLNRRGLQQVLSLELERMQHSGVGVLVLLIDIDGFKQINDTLGHTVGDVVLKEISRKIRDCVRGVDFVSRIGGDEFVVLLPKATPTDAVRVAERVRTTISAIVIQGSSGTLDVTASMAAMMLTPETPSIDELLMRLQQVLVRSKSTGKNKVSYGGAEFDDTARRLEFQNDMVTALSHGHRVYSARQAIVDLRTNQITAYEFLSRYGSPPEEMPDTFFRICAERNVLTLVDHQCMRTAIGTSSSLDPGLRRHINLFPSTILAIPAEHILAGFPATNPAGRFCIEISESQIIGDPSYLIEPVSALRAAGVKIAIDDVGFGNSCLESLVYLQPDVIKLDKRCGRGIGDDKAKVERLHRLLRIAIQVTDEVILEGIETDRDLAVARDLGVPYGQGYLWGMPRIEPALDRSIAS